MNRGFFLPAMRRSAAMRCRAGRSAFRRNHGKPRAVRTVVMAMVALAMLGTGIAQARVSPDDGFAPDGSYRWHFELAPYLWLPATTARVELGNGASANVNAGVPSVSQLREALTGAFLGIGQVRYGPWSAQIDINYVATSVTRSVPPVSADSTGGALNTRSSLVRVAPGFGYEVYRGAVEKVPTTIDALVGFSYFTDSTTLKLTQFAPDGSQLAINSVDGSISFVRPWVGFRAAFYPWPRFRFQLNSIVTGLGIDAGSWGWGAGINLTWAATKSVNLFGGFNALGFGYKGDSGDMVRAIHTIEYGPVIGMSLTF